jgi:hypothetical protein
MTSFSKFLVKGRDAQSVLQGIVANDVAVPPGTTVYTGMLNERGTYESDFTLTRLADDQYLLVTGTAQTTRDFDMIDKAIPHDKHCTLVDVTGQYAVLAVMGPRSRELLQSVSKADWSNEAFGVRPKPRGRSRLRDGARHAAHLRRRTRLGTVRAGRIRARRVRDACMPRASVRPRQRGLLRDRLVADRERLSRMGPRTHAGYNPFEAGLSFACKLDKDIPFRGRDALLRLRAEPLRRRMVVLTADGAADRMLWGGEAILRDGKPVGFVSSAAFGHTLGCPVAMGYVNNPDGVADAVPIWKRPLRDRCRRRTAAGNPASEGALRSALGAREKLSGRGAGARGQRLSSSAARHARKHAIAPDQSMKQRGREMQQHGREHANASQVRVQRAQQREQFDVMRRDRRQMQRAISA